MGIISLADYWESQKDKGTKACLKILDLGGQKIQPRIAWIMVGKVLKPKQVNIAMERICQEELDKNEEGPLILGLGGQNIATKTCFDTWSY